MNTLQCRLCSSTNSLISVYSGKQKLFRNYIQSLTSYSIGIKFEKHDLRKYICYTCVVQVYNCYVFKICCVENDKKLQATLIEKNSNVEGSVQEYTDNMSLPNLDELKQHFLPWLLSKQTLNIDVEQDEDKVKHNFTQTDLSSLNMVNTYSQCDIQTKHKKKRMKDKDVQTLFDCHLEKFDISCQTDLPTLISQHNYEDTRTIVKTTDIASKTNCVQYKTIAVQTTSRRQKKNGISSSIEKKNVNNGNILQRKSMPEIIKSAKYGLNGYSVTGKVELKNFPKIHFVEDIKKLSDAADIDISLPVNEEKPKLKCEGNQSFKAEIIKSDDIDHKPKEDSTKELLPNAEVRTDLDKQTKPLPKAVSLDLQSQNLSPSSSGLYSVKDKVEYVRVCSYCDHTLYSKNEMKSHWRKHLKCRYCQRRFTSLQKVKVHMNFQCEGRIKEKVYLIPLEKKDDVKERYPHIIHEISGKRKRSVSSD